MPKSFISIQLDNFNFNLLIPSTSSPVIIVSSKYKESIIRPREVDLTNKEES